LLLAVFAFAGLEFRTPFTADVTGFVAEAAEGMASIDAAMPDCRVSIGDCMVFVIEFPVKRDTATAMIIRIENPIITKGA